MIVSRPSQPIPRSWSHSIFLAGPTPRDPSVASWRPEAIEILERLGYDGVVFVPESEDGAQPSYDDQVEWERKMLDSADVIAFWIPREMGTLPGLTTNVEFGLYVRSGKVILGAPPGALSITYLEDSLNRDAQAPPRFTTLMGTMACAMSTHCMDTPVLKTGGLRHVPNNILKNPEFARWLSDLTSTGNRLDDLRVQWVNPLPNKDVPFAFSAMVKIWVDAEQRYKENEFITSRTDLVTIVMKHRDYFVLVEEFRSCYPRGKVLEFPSGSVEGDPKEQAVKEVMEETGLVLTVDRFTELDNRPMSATYSIHRNIVFGVILNRAEMEVCWEAAEHSIQFGADDEERTCVRVMTKEEVTSSDADWPTIGAMYRLIDLAGG